MEIQWTLVLFTLISGTGAWLFASAALGEILNKEKEASKIETIVAFVLIVIGGCLSVLHLKHPDRILEALNRPTSGIFIEAALIGITSVILAIFFIMILRNASLGSRKVVAGIGAVAAIVLTYACGSSYMMEARPAWDTIALPIAYLGTAASAGTALNLLIKIALKRSEESVKFAGILALGGSVLGLVTAAIFCFSSGADLFSSEHNLSIWIIVLFAALVLAGIGSAIAIKKPGGKGLGLAVAAFAGGFVAALALRAVMWLMGSPLMDFFLMPLE